MATSDLNEFCIRHWRWTPCLCKNDFERDCHTMSDVWCAQMLSSYHSGGVSRAELENAAKTMMGADFEVHWTDGVA